MVTLFKTFAEYCQHIYTLSRLNVGGTLFKTFAKYCQHIDTLSPKARHTVEVILRKCPQAKIDKLQSLDLQRNKIEDITPLSALTNLQ